MPIDTLTEGDHVDRSDDDTAQHAGKGADADVCGK